MFSLFTSSKQKAVINHLGKLVKLAKADGEFHKKEKLLIMKIGKEYGLSESKLNSLIFHPPIYDDVIPESLDDRFFQLLDFVKLMSVDGHISEEEMVLYYSLAQQLGFKKVILDVLLECIDRGLENDLSKDKIREECEAFIVY